MMNLVAFTLVIEPIAMEIIAITIDQLVEVEKLATELVIIQQITEGLPVQPQGFSHQLTIVQVTAADSWLVDMELELLAVKERILDCCKWGNNHFLMFGQSCPQLVQFQMIKPLALSTACNFESSWECSYHRFESVIAIWMSPTSL